MMELTWLGGGGAGVLVLNFLPIPKTQGPSSSVDFFPYSLMSSEAVWCSMLWRSSDTNPSPGGGTLGKFFTFQLQWPCL